MPDALTVYPVTSEAAFAPARAIRQRVFVEEQECPPEEEWDAHDPPSPTWWLTTHLLGEVDGQPVAVSRWREVEKEVAPGVLRLFAKLERFAVLPTHRGHGIGRAMVAATLANARAAGHNRFVLHAQAHLQGLYESFGFEVAGSPFEEAGIPHVKMVLNDAP